jgi:hypothetical protein
MISSHENWWFEHTFESSHVIAKNSGGELLCGDEQAVPQPTSFGLCQSSWSGLPAPSSPLFNKEKAICDRLGENMQFLEPPGVIAGKFIPTDSGNF